MTIYNLQKRLLLMGFQPGPLDGLMGPSTIRAMNQALDKISKGPDLSPALFDSVVPAHWMPWAQMQRIVVHWTAGTNKASLDDRKHYHILIEGDGNLVRGIPSIDLNDSPVKTGYAAHTLSLNGDSIGVSLCGMAGAVEVPFQAGKYPLTEVQWKIAAQVLADLARRYSIPVTRKTILTHAEVQPTLGVKQRGKWDITRLPFDNSVVGPQAVGDKLRALINDRLT